MVSTSSFQIKMPAPLQVELTVEEHTTPTRTEFSLEVPYRTRQRNNGDPPRS